MKTKIDIISGFLGAGKTTFIKKIISETREKIAILENEFGEVSIDGSLIKQNGLQIKEINSGCICCTLAGDFLSAAKELIKTYKPERIMIEPSGVAKLDDVMEALKPMLQDGSAFLNMVVAVVDTARFHVYMRNFNEFYKNQIEHAHTVVLSRTDKVSAEKLQSVLLDVRALNPAAPVIIADWDQLDARTILDIAQNAGDTGEATVHEVKECACGHHHEHSGHCGHEAPEVFESWGLETEKIYSKDTIENILKTLEDGSYGNILRAKGIVPCGDGWVHFSLVPGEHNMEPAAPEKAGKICVIGSGLNKERLSGLFGQ